jgi:hypothetical protein
MRVTTSAAAMAAALASMVATGAEGHASVIMPPSRNAIDGVMPGTPWSGGKVGGGNTRANTSSPQRCKCKHQLAEQSMSINAWLANAVAQLTSAG